MMKSHFNKKILNIKNKLGNLLILLSELENLIKEEKEFISTEDLNKYFSQSKINTEKIMNTLHLQFIEEEFCFSINQIINILENDFLYINKLFDTDKFIKEE